MKSPKRREIISLVFTCQLINFLWKRGQILLPPQACHGCKMHAAGLLGQSVFLKKIKLAQVFGFGFNKPRSIYQYSDLAPRLLSQNCKFFLLSLNSQKILGYKENNTKYRSLTWTPRSHVRILIYRTNIERGLLRTKLFSNAGYIAKLRKGCTKENCSGFVTNPERFSTGLVLPFTQKWKHPK